MSTKLRMGRLPATVSAAAILLNPLSFHVNALLVGWTRKWETEF
jgi:hypothetical protein